MLHVYDKVIYELTEVTCIVVVIIVASTETLFLLTGQMFSRTALLTPITGLRKFKTYQDVVIF